MFSIVSASLRSCSSPKGQMVFIGISAVTAVALIVLGNFQFQSHKLAFIVSGSCLGAIAIGMQVKWCSATTYVAVLTAKDDHNLEEYNFQNALEITYKGKVLTFKCLNNIQLYADTTGMFRFDLGQGILYEKKRRMTSLC